MPAGTPSSEVTVTRLAASFRMAVETEFGLIRGSLRVGPDRGRRQKFSRVGLKGGPPVTERETQAMDMWIYMMTISASLTQQEVAVLIGISPSAACNCIRRALERLDNDPEYVKRFDGVRDRIRSCTWYVHHSQGRLLIAQTWALKMLERLDVISRREDLTPEVRKLVEEARTPPWKTAELVPSLYPPEAKPPFEGAPPKVEVTPEEYAHLVLVKDV